MNNTEDSVLKPNRVWFGPSAEGSGSQAVMEATHKSRQCDLNKSLSRNPSFPETHQPGITPFIVSIVSSSWGIPRRLLKWLPHTLDSGTATLGARGGKTPCVRQTLFLHRD